MRKPGKMAIARQIMLQHRELPIDTILAEMRRRKCPTTRGTLTNLRHTLRLKGEKMPNWKELRDTAGEYVRLGSKYADIMKALYENPKDSAQEIKAMLAEKGVDTSSRHIRETRSKMMGWFPEMNFTVERVPIRLKPIILTKAQEAMIPAFKRVINWALGKEIFPKKKWSLQRRRDFREFVEGEIPRMIKNYRSSKAKITYYVVNKLDFLTKEFPRKNLMEGMGISQNEAKLLVRIIREKSRGLKDNAAIAAKLGCSEKDVAELWKAYGFFQRTQYRLGKREEP